MVRCAKSQVVCNYLGLKTNFAAKSVQIFNKCADIWNIFRALLHILHTWLQKISSALYDKAGYSPRLIDRLEFVFPSGLYTGL